jgi:hypothetical protein
VTLQYIENSRTRIRATCVEVQLTLNGCGGEDASSHRGSVRHPKRPTPTNPIVHRKKNTKQNNNCKTFQDMPLTRLPTVISQRNPEVLIVGQAYFRTVYSTQPRQMSRTYGTTKTRVCQKVCDLRVPEASHGDARYSQDECGHEGLKHAPAYTGWPMTLLQSNIPRTTDWEGSSKHRTALVDR